MKIWPEFLRRLFRRETAPPTSSALLLIGMSRISRIIEEYSDSVGEEYPFGRGAIKIFTQAQVAKAISNPCAAFVVDQELRIEAKTLEALNVNNKLSEEILKQTAKNDEIRIQIRFQKEKIDQKFLTELEKAFEATEKLFKANEVLNSQLKKFAGRGLEIGAKLDEQWRKFHQEYVTKLVDALKKADININREQIDAALKPNIVFEIYKKYAKLNISLPISQDKINELPGNRFRVIAWDFVYSDSQLVTPLSTNAMEIVDSILNKKEVQQIFKDADQYGEDIASGGQTTVTRWEEDLKSVTAKHPELLQQLKLQRQFIDGTSTEVQISVSDQLVLERYEKMLEQRAAEEAQGLPPKPELG